MAGIHLTYANVDLAEHLRGLGAVACAQGDARVVVTAGGKQYLLKLTEVMGVA